jgi:DNA-binding transcriptional MerR regulator
MQKASARNMKASNAYPDKLFYKIGEVSKIAGVEPYVLRYWESEFQFLRPRKSKSGQRIYVKKDLDLIFQIKNLLYKERYTIEGVRKKLGDVAPVRKHSASRREASSNQQSIEHIKKRLREILRQLQ